MTQLTAGQDTSIMLLPLIDGGAYELSVRPSTPTFVLGANGAGKSSLMQKLKQLRPADSEWVVAHRQNWLSDNELIFTPVMAKYYAESIQRLELGSLSARWSIFNP